MTKNIAVLICVSFLSVVPMLYAQEKTFTIEQVIDGDTLRLSNGEQIYLRGIVCPRSLNHAKLRQNSAVSEENQTETGKLAEEMAGFIRKIAEGREVRIEYDAQQRDKQGRLLAEVFIITDQPANSKVNWPDDYVIMTTQKFQEIFLNATLLRAGYARISEKQPSLKYQALFSQLQEGAKEHGKGLWLNNRS